MKKTFEEQSIVVQGFINDKHDMVIANRMAEMAALAKEIEAYRQMGAGCAGQELIAFHELEYRLAILNEKKEQDLKLERKKGKTRFLREKGRKLVSLFRGLKDTTDDDIEAAEKSASLAQSKLKELKAKQQLTIVSEQTKLVQKALHELDFPISEYARKYPNETNVMSVVQSFFEKCKQNQK